MSVSIKTQDEITKMRVAGRLAAEVLEMIEPQVKAGMTTAEIDKICHDYIVDTQKVTPAPLNYKGFPKSICTSVNNVVCHGIPGDRVLKQGDFLNIDVTVKTPDGYHGDTSIMVFVDGPKASKKDKIKRLNLMQATREAMISGIHAVKAGIHLGEVSKAIQDYIDNHHVKYSIVEEFCGHGIGSTFHEDPQVIHYWRKNMDVKNSIVLKAGMTFTIEPMINAGKAGTKIDPKDGWTATTRDRSDSAQWEHTILVTDDGYEVLTLRKGEII